MEWQEMPMERRTVVAALLGMVLAMPGWAADPAPLVLEAKIPLGTVSGRIDHFAFDRDRQLLFVAELGNDSVAVVDLEKRNVVHRIPGLTQPQGIAYHAATATLYVANAGDGSLRLFQGSDFTPLSRIELGADADNIRIDRWRDRLIVGYGKGGLAVIDPASRRKVADMPLDGHPESFQLDETGARIFVNVPDAPQIAALDAVTGRQVSMLENSGASANFAMAVDPDQHRVLIAFRKPSRLVAFATATGQREAGLETCRDADDVFVDTRRRRIYLSCGDGAIDVIAPAGGDYQRIARIPTVSGARTSLFVPETDRLYLGVRATSSEPAAIWVFRPQP
jgi:DNA-binding beta-propeller fold protein YncE